jgi:hypothetical protein
MQMCLVLSISIRGVMDTTFLEHAQCMKNTFDSQGSRPFRSRGRNIWGDILFNVEGFACAVTTGTALAA